MLNLNGKFINAQLGNCKQRSYQNLVMIQYNGK